MYVSLFLEMEIPKSLRTFFNEAGEIAAFTTGFFRELIRPKHEFREFIKQCYIIGYKSLPLIAITGFIMGLVLTMQLRPSLTSYGVEAELPVMVSLAVVREIGPVITALIFAGKIGSSMGAELGSMRVTEQIDAMDVSGTNPFKFLVVTRVLAATLMLPILVVLSDTISLYGTYIGVNIRGNTSSSLFFSQVFHSLEYSDALPATVKTFFFGFAVGIIGCYKGYYSKRGTEGVGRAANSAVVIASLAVFILDLLAVQITDVLGIN